MSKSIVSIETGSKFNIIARSILGSDGIIGDSVIAAGINENIITLAASEIVGSIGRIKSVGIRGAGDRVRTCGTESDIALIYCNFLL